MSTIAAAASRAELNRASGTSGRTSIVFEQNRCEGLRFSTQTLPLVAGVRIGGRKKRHERGENTVRVEIGFAEMTDDEEDARAKQPPRKVLGGESAQTTASVADDFTGVRKEVEIICFVYAQHHKESSALSTDPIMSTHHNNTGK